MYTHCKELNLLDVDDDRSLFDFLNAVSGIISGFSEYWLREIQRKQDKGKALPDLYKIVELFRNDMRITNANAKRGGAAFPATFQGKPIRSEERRVGKE